jgi:DNA-binding transcriptional regulator YiaG
MKNLSASSEALALAEVRQWAKTGKARQTRERAHLSLADIAAAVSVTTPAISRWECGLRAPRGAAALRYHALLRTLNQQSARDAA